MDKPQKPLETLKSITDKVLILPDDPYQTARDTSDAYSETYMSRLKKLAEQHRTLTEPYCIEVKTRRDLPTAQALHVTFIVRRSLPLPMWEQTVYEVDNRAGGVFLCWSFPNESEAKQIVKRPDLFDTNTVEYCRDFLSVNDSDEEKIELTIASLMRKWHNCKQSITV